jgi:hypothetical protein
LDDFAGDARTFGAACFPFGGLFWGIQLDALTQPAFSWCNFPVNLPGEMVGVEGSETIPSDSDCELP